MSIFFQVVIYFKFKTSVANYGSQLYFKWAFYPRLHNKGNANQ